jgi:hypothetical protein
LCVRCDFEGSFQTQCHATSRLCARMSRLSCSTNDSHSTFFFSLQDVLCGRGGMSNHHPGNEWYRRLVRSNRPLYRACPKHTKLLVSKAIVQAVEQQGGRFLEKDRKQKYWFPVQYKKAVDKTSQGLRERDREEELIQHEGKVPDGFNGIGQAKLTDLADVAISHAIRTTGLLRSATDISKQSLPTTQITPAQSFMESQHLVGVEGSQPLNPAIPAHQSSMFRLMHQTDQLPGNSNWRNPGMSGPGGFPQGGFHQGVCPTQMNPHMTLPHQRPTIPMSLAMLKQPPPQHQPQPFGHPQANFPPNATSGMPFVSGVQNNVSSSLMYPNLNPGVSAYVMAPLGNEMAHQAPALNRLTSQVSDWLQNFYPLQQSNPQQQQVHPRQPTEAERLYISNKSYERAMVRQAQQQRNIVNMEQHKLQQLQNMQQAQATKIGQGQTHQLQHIVQQHQQQDQSKRRAHTTLVDQRFGKPLAGNGSHSQSVKGGKKGKNGEVVEINITTFPPPEPSKPIQITIPAMPVPRKNKRKSASSLPSLPFRTAPARQKSLSCNNGDSSLVPPTSEIEHSVSNTLLQLASAPSNLVAGCSAFMSESTEVSNDIPSEGEESASVVVGGKVSKDSLLDDHEETPDETRLRTIRPVNWP